MIENRRKKGWRRAGARYLRVGDKSARLNRGVKGGRSGTGEGGGDEGSERGGRMDGRGPDIAWLWRGERKKEKEEWRGGREEGALERRYRYGIMKTRMYF